MCVSINSYYYYNKLKNLAKGWHWIIDSVLDHTISISEYSPLAGSGYIKLPNELDHPKKGLIFKILTIMNALNGVWSNT